MQPKGLICAGGEATRLGELTRVANKHLLPVGSWPMIYYPLQLLQLAGIRDVLLVTGKGHAGQMIDLLAGGAPLVVVLGDNIFEVAQSQALREWAEEAYGARIFVKEVDDPENFGVVVYEDGRVADIVEKAGVVDLRYETPPSSHAVVGLYCYPPDVFDVIASLEPSSRGELEITDVNRHYALQGRLDAREVEGWWEDAGKHWQHLADIGRRIDETGANKGEAA